MAGLDKKWKILSGWEGELLSEYPGWFLNLLANRGLKSGTEIKNFLAPEYTKLMSPEAFQNIKESVDLIKKAKAQQWKVTVYGDYDVDGVTSTALMVDLLSRIGIKNIEKYIPHRLDEGYGLHQEALKEIQGKGTNLVIAVDCGIGSGELIDSAEFKDIQFLIIDHHEINTTKMSKKAVILHPQMTKKKGETQILSAAGMAFYFSLAIQSEFPRDIPEGQEKWFLDLVALSTIADVMPLSGQNRLLASFGLKVLAKTKRLGLQELAKVASFDMRDVSAYSVGFLLAPRLNAAGRIENAEMALKLLLTKDQAEAKYLAGELNRLNIERQNMCEKILEEARAEIEGSAKKDHEIYLLSNPNWPRGVVGIIAARLSESYKRPVIVFEKDGDSHHGSARSVEGFDITEALSECAGCLEKFGGHAKAAGLTVSDEKFVIFGDKLLEITKKKIKEVDITPWITIDTEIKSEQINDEAMELIQKMEPFGYGNNTPVFEMKKIQIETPKLVGSDQNHLKFKIKSSHQSQITGLNAIQFNISNLPDTEKYYDIAFQLKYNIWNNCRSIDIRVIDMRVSK